MTVSMTSTDDAEMTVEEREVLRRAIRKMLKIWDDKRAASDEKCRQLPLPLSTPAAGVARIEGDLAGSYPVLASSLRKLQHTAFKTSCDNGWWDDQKVDGGVDYAAAVATIPEKLALIHSEVSEALEDYRDGKLTTERAEKGKPVGLPTELADVIIRVLDLAGALGLDMQAEVQDKLAFNKTRSHRHGGKRC